MIERIGAWLADLRREGAAREAKLDGLCAHNGSDPMCSQCAVFFNGV